MSDDRETWCPDASRYDRGECGWPTCGCPDNGPTDAEVGHGKSNTTARLAHQTSIMNLRSLMAQFAERIHPNQIKDIMWCIEANEMALKEAPHAD